MSSPAIFPSCLQLNACLDLWLQLFHFFLPQNRLDGLRQQLTELSDRLMTVLEEKGKRESEYAAALITPILYLFSLSSVLISWLILSFFQYNDDEEGRGGLTGYVLATDLYCVRLVEAKGAIDVLTQRLKATEEELEKVKKEAAAAPSDAPSNETKSCGKDSGEPMEELEQLRNDLMKTKEQIAMLEKDLVEKDQAQKLAEAKLRTSVSSFIGPFLKKSLAKIN